jgi:signal transduction histidine kinase
MTADRTSQASIARVGAFLSAVFGRFRYRAADSARSADVPDRLPPRIDLGDLAVAQFVHDLRNHLTVITTCAERAADLVPQGPAGQELAEVRRCAERASLLSRELLMAARPRYVARGIVDLNQAVTAAMVTVSRFIGGTIGLHVRLSPQRLPVVAEVLELERILLNLALNSGEAMLKGGALSIETALVEASSAECVDSALEAPFARLTVCDTGSGMTPDVQARMFEPFFTTRERGTGLGLSSVAFTVRQLQGTLSVESEPGRGTCVTVQLPCAR